MKISNLNQKIILLTENKLPTDQLATEYIKFVPFMNVRASVIALSKTHEFKITIKNMNFNKSISAIAFEGGEEKVVFPVVQSQNVVNSDDKYLTFVVKY
ncbi:MAG: hypothetical protein LBI26_01300 [Holosporales bacterium]|jgi:hypothetical protein|nr:hypothetical protein [Holosporales bacterium]